MFNYLNYIIQPTDSVRSIAERFGVSLDELVKLNPQVCVPGPQMGIKIKIPVDHLKVVPIEKPCFIDQEAESVGTEIAGYQLQLPKGELYQFDKIVTEE